MFFSDVSEELSWFITVYHSTGYVQTKIRVDMLTMLYHNIYSIDRNILCLFRHNHRSRLLLFIHNCIVYQHRTWNTQINLHKKKAKLRILFKLDVNIILIKLSPILFTNYKELQVQCAASSISLFFLHLSCVPGACH